MNLSTLQIGSPMQGVPIIPSLSMDLIADFSEVGGITAPKLKEFSKQSVKPISFRGRLEIPGSRFVKPEQNFRGMFSGPKVTFENAPENAWPGIRVVLIADPLTDLVKLGSFQVRQSENSTDGEVLYTRIHWMLSSIGQCSLHIDGLEETFYFKFEPFTNEEKKRLLYRAKIYRKLKFIEEVFRCRFALPQEVSPDQVRAIDFVFRGITEGEFVTRGDGIKSQLQSSDIDLTKPPFDGPGPFRYSYTEKILDLFNHSLEVGPSIVMLKQAELADPKVARQIRQGYQGLIWVKFSVLDHLINIRFENYAVRPKKQRQEKLKSFKQKFLKDDPEELGNLLDESLMADVSAKEASLIAMGWTQYNRLPDRYCPQPPTFVPATNVWRVPLWLGYPNGQGGEVGELLIDAKTGKIISHTPLEDVRSRGKSLATELLHAA